MVIDTSALVAIERREQDCDLYLNALYRAQGAWLSAASLVEFTLVLAGPGSTPVLSQLDRRLVAIGIRTLPVTLEDAVLAREAFLKYGKGRHPARLNFGDCFSYALAKRLAEPLLFKGSDFSQTDLQPAMLT